MNPTTPAKIRNKSVGVFGGFMLRTIAIKERHNVIGDRERNMDLYAGIMLPKKPTT
jgi:hypothetical protein